MFRPVFGISIVSIIDPKSVSGLGSLYFCCVPFLYRLHFTYMYVIHVAVSILDCWDTLRCPDGVGHTFGSTSYFGTFHNSVPAARSTVKAAVETCHRAGVRVVMITGDQPATAAAIGANLGIKQEGTTGACAFSVFVDVHPDSRRFH